MLTITDWRELAACRDSDPSLFFPIGTTGPAVDQIELAAPSAHSARFAKSASTTPWRRTRKPECGAGMPKTIAAGCASAGWPSVAAALAKHSAEPCYPNPIVRSRSGSTST